MSTVYSDLSFFYRFEERPVQLLALLLVSSLIFEFPQKTKGRSSSHGTRFVPGNDPPVFQIYLGHFPQEKYFKVHDA